MRKPDTYIWVPDRPTIGNYKYLSLLMLVLLFTLFPHCLKLYWPYVEDCLQDVPFYALIVLTINFTTISVYCFVMYFIYTLKLPFFQQFRNDPKLGWPWETDPANWRSRLLKTMRVCLINVVGGVFLLYIDSLISFKIQMKTVDFPSTFSIVWQFFFFLYMQQILFYLAHRTMHHPKLYFLHKRHHEYNITMVLAFVYSSQVEQISNLLASGLVYKILAEFYPVHIFTVIIWVSFRLVESMDGHCGYDWPWGISNWVPLCAGGDYHFFHHSNNVGNYGAIVHVFDTLCGTNKDYLQYQERQRKKQQLKQA